MPPASLTRHGAHLRYVDGLVVNPKRVYHVMKAADLLVPRPTRPNEWWGIDMTPRFNGVMIEGFGWVYLVVVLDWHSKKVLGHYAGLQAPRLALAGGTQPCREPPVPARHRRPAVEPDGRQRLSATSLAFLRACAALGIRQAFTSDNNPKGNADTERFVRTLKEELVWLREWTSPAALLRNPRPLAR